MEVHDLKRYVPVRFTSSQRGWVRVRKKSPTLVWLVSHSPPGSRSSTPASPDITHTIYRCGAVQ
jgi:hypothetical protein